MFEFITVLKVLCRVYIFSCEKSQNRSYRALKKFALNCLCVAEAGVTNGHSASDVQCMTQRRASRNAHCRDARHTSIDFRVTLKNANRRTRECCC